MYHTLEHLPYPLQSLKRVSELLADDGVLIIKGPNLGSFDRIWHDKRARDWRGYDVPFHLYHFTPKTYQMILEKAGFSVQKVTFQYWDPVAHLMEIMLGDGIRDHPPDVTKNFKKSKIDNNPIFRYIDRSIRIVARLLNLKDKDLTIYAKKRDVSRL